jgi:hypothetical protein
MFFKMRVRYSFSVRVEVKYAAVNATQKVSAFATPASASGLQIIKRRLHGPASLNMGTLCLVWIDESYSISPNASDVFPVGRTFSTDSNNTCNAGPLPMFTRNWNPALVEFEQTFRKLIPRSVGYKMS